MNKIELLKTYNKEDKMALSSILDKAELFLNRGIAISTNFLDMHIQKEACNILNKLKINYMLFGINEYIERKVILFIPEFLKLEEVLKQYITCIKITSKTKDYLKHKDYMGSIYNIGIKEEMIGDIIVCDNCAYIFVISSIYDFLLNNYNKVGRNEVFIEQIDLSEIDKNILKPNFKSLEYNVASLRIDAILSEVYNISRSDTLDNIKKGSLYINAESVDSGKYIVKPNDVISFRKFGKFIYKDVIRITKSNRTIVEILKYE